MTAWVIFLIVMILLGMIKLGHHIDVLTKRVEDLERRCDGNGIYL